MRYTKQRNKDHNSINHWEQTKNFKVREQESFLDEQLETPEKRNSS